MRSRSALPGRMLALLVAAGAASALGWRYRSWHLTWGATRDEVAGPMPGDDLLTRAHFVATRAISIAAPMSSTADDRTAFRVAIIDAPRALVWGKPDSIWAWRLTEDGSGGTRLVTRLKARYDAGPLLPLTVVLMELGDFPMMRRTLRGIAERAERPHRTREGGP